MFVLKTLCRTGTQADYGNKNYSIQSCIEKFSEKIHYMTSQLSINIDLGDSPKFSIQLFRNLLLVININRICQSVLVTNVLIFLLSQNTIGLEHLGWRY